MNARIGITSEGITIEWEPENSQTDKCCLDLENDFIGSLEELGLKVELQDIDCKLPLKDHLAQGDFYKGLKCLGKLCEGRFLNFCRGNNEECTNYSNKRR